MTNIFPLLQASGNAPAPGGGGLMWIFLIAIFVIFYVFMILPQRKKQKQVEEFRKSLEKGDKVTTIGGIHGKIVDVKESTFVIEIANDVRIEVDKAAIAVDENMARNAAKNKDNQ
ncbi:MAG: preprotein translocase subunit YajC [Bacteroidales bacterium]|nr:preprotein translocase subunit YajC [Bacteroidales bacterium]